MKNRIADVLGTEKESTTRFLAFASGKGGVGKSVIVFNLAVMLAERSRVLIIDADVQMGNQHLLGNIVPEFGLIDVCNSGIDVSKAIVSTENGPDILASTGSSSDAVFPELPKMARFLSTMRETLRAYDFVIFDTASGILPHTNLVVNTVDDVVLVTLPELTAISNTYALFKILHGNNSSINLSLLVNREDDVEEIQYIYQKFSSMTRQFLQAVPTFCGGLGNSSDLVESVARQKSVQEISSNSLICKQLRRLTQALRGEVAAQSFQRKPLSFMPVGADIKE
ncbi:MAG: AAA family ATPase [Candidatus Zixiibacteriota bacterium]